MIVVKFGGSILDGAEGLRRVRDEILALPRPLLVVASAFANVTNRLEQIAAAAVGSETKALELLAALVDAHRTIARDALGAAALAAWEEAIAPHAARLDEIVRGLAIVHELSPRTLDLAVSIGERLASATVTAALAEAGAHVVAIPATDIIITDNRHRFARPNIELTAERVRERLLPAATADAVVVTEGYIARSISGETTTMGRESSNYSASLLAELCGATEVRIYTAVPGILTADPALVADARTLDHLSYDAARALAELGAKILHPRTVTPAEQAAIPLVIRSLDGAATTIDGTEGTDGVSIVLLSESSLIEVRAAAVSTSEEEFVRDLSSRAPLVWQSRFRRRLQFVTAARVPADSLRFELFDGPVERRVTDGAVVSLVRQGGIDAHDLAAFFSVLGEHTPLAVLGGIEQHAVGVFVAVDDAHSIVARLHERFVTAGVEERAGAAR
jgi:bifunctional aspartokinase / homoserine dehydrogenase 1